MKLSLVALFAAAATSSPTRNYLVKDSHPVPRLWSRIGRAPADHVIHLSIGLKQGNFAELERHLYEVSDPDHSRYGQHLTADEVHDLVRPAEDTNRLVHEWLAASGIAPNFEYSAARDWISFDISVADVERLLDTEYSTYQHQDGTTVFRAPIWSLPSHLHSHIDTIQPTNSFFRAIPRAISKRDFKYKFAPGEAQALDDAIVEKLPEGTTPTIANSCNFTKGVTPTCLRVLYGTYNYTPKAAGKNKVGLCDYLGESNNRSDTKLFLQKYRPDAVPAASSFTVDVIAHGNNEQTQETPKQLNAGKDLEGNLDVETILGIMGDYPLIAYTTGGRNPSFKPDKVTPTNSDEPYLTFLKYILSQPNSNVAQTISTSYGDDEQTIGLSYANRVCNSFAQLGARGVTVLFASGDNGVGNNGACITNGKKPIRQFLPEFPNDCPYLTAVGATKNYPEVAAFDPSNNFTSGGGFSNYFGQPSYQASAVDAYVKSLNGQYKGLYNVSGRAYPDLSAQGQNFDVVWNGTLVHLDGTSASTPTAAAVLALVNDALIAAGKPPLGFMNPWLYKTGYQAFNDVTSGSAAGCNVKGFPATKGWDAVTGFGTPNFPKILNLLGLSYS